MRSVWQFGRRHMQEMTHQAGFFGVYTISPWAGSRSRSRRNAQGSWPPLARRELAAMFVEVLGSVNMDIVTSTTSLPRPGETVTASDVSRFPGGKGANQAVAAARLGARTTFIGAIGDDAFGLELRGYLSDNDVDVTLLLTKENQATGQAHICVAENGENFIVVVPGANHAFTPGDLPRHESSRKKICLTQFEMPLDAIEAHWSTRPLRQVTTILNAAPAIQDGAPLFPLADFIVVNEVELAYFAGEELAAPIFEAIVDQARNLMTRDDQHVIVTIGAKGAIAVSATNWYRVASQRSPVVDTTGAGDCFCGALATGLSHGRNVRDAITFANAAAGISVGRPGAGPSMPTREDMHLFDNT